MEKDNTLLEIANSRLNLAKRFTKKWTKKVKEWIKDYEIDSLDEIQAEDLHNKLQIPYIFSTVESALPSMFNSFPSLIIKGKGKLDQKFSEFVSAVWEYIYDKTSLEEKVEDAGTMFLVGGMGQLSRGWYTDTEDVEENNQTPITNTDGSPAMDEFGQPIMQTTTSVSTVVLKDIPKVEFENYEKVFYSPESRFTIDDEFNDIPYIIKHMVMTPEEIKEKYGKKPSKDSYIDVSTIDEDLKIDDVDLCKSDLQRTDIYKYQGVLPEKQSGDKDWKSDRVYEFIFTKEEIIQKPKKIRKKNIYQVGNYGVPTKFFKFGEPKILHDLEQDISFGRSTLIDYRDRFANKIAATTDAEIDEKALRSPKKFTVVRYSGNAAPSFITPPPMPETVVMGIDQSRQDVAMTSAQLDVGRGGQSSQVDTATGQKIFQEAQSQRIERKRRKIAKFIEAIARDLLIDCSEKWDVETFAKIVDADPQDQEFMGYLEQLKTLGDRFDIEIEPETVVNNKATVGAQSIALYREMKDDPIVNRVELVKKAIQNGFSLKNVDQYLSQQLTPEQMGQAVQELVQQGVLDPNMAQQYMQNQAQGPARMGRPPSADAATIMKNSMPGSDSTQIDAQNEAAFKQQGVPK